MPPKAARPSPKAKARARRLAKARATSLVRSNKRSLERRGVLKDLNALAAELRVGVPLLSVKAVDAQALSQYWRVLNKRCVADPHRSRFRGLAQKWLLNGGQLPDGMRLPDAVLPDQDTVLTETAEATEPGSAEGLATVPRHKVLLSNFRLHSKAFMLTHNSQAFTAATWMAYRTWVRRLALRFGATAWAACLERSEHAAQAGERVHGHSYLLWEDGAGIQLENLEPLEFEGVRPRVDRCVQVANGKCLRTAALHGYWFSSKKTVRPF